MKNALKGWLALAAFCATANAGLVSNSGFEMGLTGWTTMNQLGSDGSFFSQTGTTSPVNGFAVPPPPEGIRAAMTDAEGPGSHILYQDFVVPTTGIGNAVFTFSYYLNNQAGAYSTPASLDFSTPTLNQQARIDIIATSASVFSLAGADVLQNLFQTTAATPVNTGNYISGSVDVTSLLQANAGQTLRLRIAEVDNVFLFNFGIDRADITVTAIPEPSSIALMGSALVVFGFLARRKMRKGAA